MSIRTLVQNHPMAARLFLVALLILLCVANYYLFPKLIGVEYINFYTRAGAAVALGTLLLEISWKDIDKNTGITSRDPIAYLGSTLQLIGLPIMVLGVHLQKQYNKHRISLLNLLFTLPFILVVLNGLIIWLFTIAPAQYFINYICRAPSMLINNSNARIYAQLKDGWELKTEIRNANEESPADAVNPWWDASMQNQQRKLTSAYSAILLIALAWVL
jgi:hypothetical protein